MTLRRFLAFLFCFALAAPALADPLDKAANKKIDEAINVHYLGTDFKKAIGVLEGTVEACGEKCSNSVLARAYMYIGIVKGAGLQDKAGAEEAFATALALDPAVALDKDLATEDLVALFEKSGGTEQGSAPPPAEEEEEEEETEEEEEEEVPGIGAGDGITCTPDVAEIEVRRPMPVACRGSQPATKAVLYYKEFGAPSYSKITMSLSGSDWLGMVPCAATSIQGELKWFVATSGGGGALEAYGSETEPNVIQVVTSTAEPPPAYPGKEPPSQCADAQDCPEEMRGTPTCPDVPGASTRGDKSWGAGCDSHQECQEGLFCLNGSCESPPSCETGADCDSGVCEEFVCKMNEDDDGGGGGGGGGPAGAPENFIGAAFGLDFTSLSGQYVCNASPAAPTMTTDAAGQAVNVDSPQAEASGFTCYIGDAEYYSHPYSNAANSGTVPSGFATGTMRVFVTYEHIFAEKFGAEAQAGLAFSGAPRSGIGQLLHLAVFGKYWFTGTGQGLKLYGAVGGGLGQVDAHKAIAVQEENLGPVDPNNPYNYYGSTEYRSSWSGLYCPPGSTSCPISPVQAYKSFGQAFVGGGVGAMLNLGTVAFDLRLLGKFMLPASAVVIQPTLGAVVPF